MSTYVRRKTREEEKGRSGTTKLVEFKKRKGRKKINIGVATAAKTEKRAMEKRGEKLVKIVRRRDE